MTGVRFLHIADLHLDSPFKGISAIPHKRWTDIRESTFNAFTNIIEYATETKPDFILIVGDIYDGENRSLRAQHLFQKGMESLQIAGIPVFICHGNHDHLSGKWVRFQLPENVQVFKEAVETKQLTIRGSKVHITGFSYKERHIREKMHSFYPVSQTQELHIGMLHGSVEGNAEHDVYAPFTKHDLLQKGYDYWALGHIHKRQILHDEPPIIYPGNTQSRHRNEKGVKGFYDVSLSKGKADYQFVPSSSFIYDEINICCEGVIHANELITRVEKALLSYRENTGNALVELTLTNIDNDAEELIHATTKDEWLSIFQESTHGVYPFIVIQQLTYDLPKRVLKESSMLMQSIQEWAITDWKHVLKDVYQHPKGSRYFSPIDADFIEETIGEVEQLLVNAVEKGGNKQ